MASRLPKPSGLRMPQMRVAKPLEPIPESSLNRAHEAPVTISRVMLNARLKRRSKSVSDLRSTSSKPTDFASVKLAYGVKKPQTFKKSENRPFMTSKGTPPKRELNFGSTKSSTTTSTSGISGVKRPAPKSNVDGQPKLKASKKIPDWDYKSRYNALREKFISSQETIQGMESEISECNEIKVNYTKVQNEAKELTEKTVLLTTKCEELSEKNKELLESNEKFKSDWTLLQKAHRHLECEYTDSQNNNKKLSEENELNSRELTRLKSTLSDLSDRHEKLTKEYKELLQKYNELQEKYNFFTEQNKDLLKSLNVSQIEAKELKEILTSQKNVLLGLQAERRILRNVIQDLKGNIRVFCRVRPPINAEEFERLQCYINFIDENSLEIRKSRESVNQITGKVQDLKFEFSFDKVFPMDSTQEEMFEDLSQLVQSALDGYNICVFAYGQTGSGKTYTMQGGENPEHKGMIPRTIDCIFENITELERMGWRYSVQASFLEIYNENVRDLLNINSSQKLEICFNDGKGTTVTNLTTQSIESAEELKEYMKLAHRNRATAATNFNEHSSRSHAVTKIYLEGIMKDQNVMYKGSINLVDLAGSENAKQSVSGERLTETKNINKSLATLGDVISSLHSKSKHIPYRNSKLTYLLQSSLGGNSKTLMVVNISPFDECFGESISSLRFAAKVKEVKVGSKRNKLAIVPPTIKEKSTLT